MLTPVDRYVLYLLFQFEELSGIKGVIYTPYETLYRITSPHAFHPSSIRHAVNNLIRNDFVEKIARNQSSLFTLTEKGKSFSRDLFQIIANPSSSSPAEVPFWWGVLFDIPESKRHIRDTLRSTLLNIGFVPWQKSVYVYPGGVGKDALIKQLVEQEQWAKYISLLSIEKVYQGDNLLELCKRAWGVDNLYAHSIDLMQKARYICEQIGKRALNKRQLNSLLKNGQILSRDLFRTLEELINIPPQVTTSKINQELPRVLYTLTTKLTDL